MHTSLYIMPYSVVCCDMTFWIDQDAMALDLRTVNPFMSLHDKHNKSEKVIFKSIFGLWSKNYMITIFRMYDL